MNGQRVSMPASVLIAVVVLAACTSAEKTPPSSPTASIPSPAPYTIGTGLAPGTYVSRVFQTRVRFTVPAGWKVFEDEPGQFGLAIVANDGPCICFWRDVRLMAASCNGAEPGVGTTAEAIASALAARPGMAASTPQAVSVGGLNGVRIDLKIDPSWKGTCPFSQGRPAVPTLIGSGISASVAWDVEPNGGQRVYLLDLGPASRGTNLAINIDVCCGVEWQQRMDEVAPVIASLVFGAS